MLPLHLLHQLKRSIDRDSNNEFVGHFFFLVTFSSDPFVFVSETRSNWKTEKAPRKPFQIWHSYRRDFFPLALCPYRIRYYIRIVDFIFAFIDNGLEELNFIAETKCSVEPFEVDDGWWERSVSHFFIPRCENKLKRTHFRVVVHVTTECTVQCHAIIAWPEGESGEFGHSIHRMIRNCGREYCVVTGRGWTNRMNDIIREPNWSWSSWSISWGFVYSFADKLLICYREQKTHSGGHLYTKSIGHIHSVS